MDLFVEREIEAPAAEVWAVVTDLDRFATVLTAVERVERVDGGDGFGIGTRWRETRKVFTREATEELEVVAVEPGHSYTTAATSRGTEYISVTSVTAIDDGRSRLSITFAAEPSGALGRLLSRTVGRAFIGATRKMLARDLDDIAAAVEAAHPR